MTFAWKDRHSAPSYIPFELTNGMMFHISSHTLLTCKCTGAWKVHEMHPKWISTYIGTYASIWDPHKRRTVV